MTVIYQHNGLTLERHNYSHGVEYRLTDGIYACSLSTLPAQSELPEIWQDYLEGRFEGIETLNEEILN